MNNESLPNDDATKSENIWPILNLVYIEIVLIALALYFAIMVGGTTWAVFGFLVLVVGAWGGFILWLR